MNKKIYLFCSLGISTNLLAIKIQNVANKNKLPIEVKAFSYYEIDKIVEQKKPDCILLGPQVKFNLKEVQTKFAEKIPVDIINSIDYSSMNGENILENAMKMIKTHNLKY